MKGVNIKEAQHKEAWKPCLSKALERSQAKLSKGIVTLGNTLCLPVRLIALLGVSMLRRCSHICHRFACRVKRKVCRTIRRWASIRDLDVRQQKIFDGFESLIRYQILARLEATSKKDAF
eukprot:2765700-Amphidinium_carterae.1